MKKILVYSHDAYGLGNIRRMLEIVQHLVESDPEVSVLLLSGSPMAHAFRIPQGVDYIKLPCIGRNEKGEKSVRSLGIDFDNTVRLRANIIMMAALDFDPDLVLVDKKPFGIGDELKMALAMLRTRAKRPKTVLLLRDILDSAEATTRQWERNGYHEVIREHYDQVLIVGTEEVFDAAREYRFPETTASKVRYCGYIRRPLPARSREEVRAEHGVGPGELMVLVTAGGGADGYAMMAAYLRGLHDRGGAVRHRTLLISGPEMSELQREEIFTLAAASPGVTVREFTSDMIGCMNAADLVVSMGGYNTVCELLTLRRKSILVPRAVPSEEQWLRAERMQRMGLLRAIHPDDLTPGTLLCAVEEELATPGTANPALERFELDGLPRISAALLALAATRRQEMRRAPTSRLPFTPDQKRLRPQPAAAAVPA